MKPLFVVYSLLMAGLGFGQVNVQVHDASGNESVHVPVTVDNFNRIIAMQYAIQFDPAMLEFEGMEVNGLLTSSGCWNDQNLYNQSDERTIKLVWDACTVEGVRNGVQIEDGDILMTLVFSAKQFGTTEVKVLSLPQFHMEFVDIHYESLPSSAEYGTVSIVPGTLDDVESNTPEGTLGTDTSSNITLRQYVSRSGGVRTQIYDMSGKLVFDGYRETLVTLERSASLQPGMYVVLQENEERNQWTSHKLMVVGSR